MRFRKLRIAWSATCLVACGLLIVLWVRSYWRYDWSGGIIVAPTNGKLYGTSGCLFESANGVVAVVYVGNVWQSLSYLSSLGSSSAEPNLRVIKDDDAESAYWGFRGKVSPNGVFRGSAPIWFFVVASDTFAALPWFRWRFALRTLLIATTLVAVALGLAVYVGKK